ncbi:precorrin-6y C5,15-methyltransferase (decarboxylating) subunit CbiE [Carboxylicivirga sp. A043]|uniref:precorrin-6y C5,15-methyltransferase (decarboxylating) subunit CbiE n=1 Tax=Carboxylicivirga litoralis TaxID=2816963 RepID=UPI0021CB3C27|nr:precorrin-6y C5,15-methyltransferase (decarboxylating) subunit CbiE [Carboxylicivirga sp. A043]MCU4155664.1 precorrin-6y C5,15-methyltransferase (decarboxylating) subunit CbiE [Carboxylicivirga sp. A043]
MCKFHVVGISDQAKPELSVKVKELLQSHLYFSGGKRHYELVREWLPANHQWIDVLVPLAETFNEYNSIDASIVVFASGDPLFFGIGNTLKREFPDEAITVYPSFNSLQMLAHECQLPYGTMKVATLTGRPWINLDQELIKGTALIGILTDKQKKPAAIAQRIMAFGFVNYRIYLGERMGGDAQQVRKLSVEECAKVEAEMPNCLIIEQTEAFERTFGINEGDFHFLKGRPKMITKRSIRLMSLSMLKLDSASVLWDIGFCTGSVSIETKQMAPHVDVFSIEKREESRELMQKNQFTFRVPGINAFIGDFFKTDLKDWPQPDRIFIGGHGGRLMEMIKQLEKQLKPGGIIVFNAVSNETLNQFKQAIATVSMTISDEMQLLQDDHNPVTIIQATKQ